jgi:2-dehydropantoate 2-reductase
MAKVKILVAGIGGIGGYFGGLLAKKYYNHKEIEIYFLARGAHLIKIKNYGLQIIDNDTKYTVKPNLISDNPNDFGKVDYILVCTKTYDLENIISQLAPTISASTVIIPLQNGVDNTDKIKKIVPNNLVTRGCVYLISRQEKPGLIVKKGTIESLFFGVYNDNKSTNLQFLQKILLEASIQATLSEDITKIIWEKFIFLSSITTATTYFNTEIGPILKDSEKTKLLIYLINEVSHLAAAKNIPVEKNQVAIVLQKLKSLPYEATSSMHSDFKNNKNKTELESLTGYVVTQGRKEGVHTPTFNKMYKALIS